MPLVDDMTKSLCKYLKESGLTDVETEHPCGGGKRVDIYAILNENGYDLGIEIKTSKEDFKTGYGRNFDFFINYVAVPRHLVCHACGLKHLGNIPEYVGVVSYNDRCPHDLWLVEVATLNPSWGNVWEFQRAIPYTYSPLCIDHGLKLCKIEEVM